MAQSSSRQFPLKYQIMVAVFIGAVLGSLKYVDRLIGPDSPVDSSSRISEIDYPVDSKVANDDRVNSDNATIQAAGKTLDLSMSEQNSELDLQLVYASNDLVLAPKTIDSALGGYVVVRNLKDNRFAEGDIIVSVDNVPVEVSAAGSEMLMAALLNTDATVQVYRRPEN